MKGECYLIRGMKIIDLFISTKERARVFTWAAISTFFMMMNNLDITLEIVATI